LGSNLARVDTTTDEEIARQIAEDPDTAPELTEDFFRHAEVWQGDRFIRRGGRPKGSGTKEMVTLRLDREVLEYFRVGGPGWQTRLNDVLRAVISEEQARAAPLGKEIAERVRHEITEAVSAADQMRRELTAMQKILSVDWSASPAQIRGSLSDATLRAVQAHGEGATPAEVLAYLTREFGMTVEPNRVGIALRRHRRAGRLENRDSRWFIAPPQGST
jgi:uncharacterized protein (DUF4415 family)